MPSAQPKTVDFVQRLKEISMFFAEKDEVYKSMRRVVRRLENASIPYAVLGGMAVNAHGYHRTTGDVDLLLTAAGLEEFRQRFVPKNYRQDEKRKQRFVDKVNKITLDILVTGLFPGSGEPGPISFPDPGKVRETVQKIQVVDLPTLIQLKLAAHRYKDFGDVVELIRQKNLDESFQEQIDPAVRRDYIECLEEKRREDQYQERLGGT